MDSTVQAETVHCFPKNKPWVTKEHQCHPKSEEGGLQSWQQGAGDNNSGGTEGEDQGGKRQVQEEAGVETPEEQHERNLEWTPDPPTPTPKQFLSLEKQRHTFHFSQWVVVGLLL